jgi:tetratricopeptide (TPR) repeat protein
VKVKRSTPNQSCERTGSSAGEFGCFFLIRALHLHPERGSREPVAPLKRSVNTMRALLLLLLVMCSCDAKDQAESALDEARRLAAQGKFQEALEKHVWFHDHALEVRPSYYGVRLSYALSDWVELGKKYPKALETLKGIRDKKTSRLLAGEADRALFHDVESINDHLGESKATVDLFRKIEVARPGFAASVYDLADEALIAAGEYGLAKKYLGDPMTRLAKAKRRFDEGIQYAKMSRSGDASRQAFESIFTDDIVRIITVLDKTGDSDKAREIQSKALAVLESPAIRNAINP